MGEKRKREQPLFVDLSHMEVGCSAAELESDPDPSAFSEDNDLHEWDDDTPSVSDWVIYLWHLQGESKLCDADTAQRLRHICRTLLLFEHKDKSGRELKQTLLSLLQTHFAKFKLAGLAHQWSMSDNKMSKLVGLLFRELLVPFAKDHKTKWTHVSPPPELGPVSLALSAGARRLERVVLATWLLQAANAKHLNLNKAMTSFLSAPDSVRDLKQALLDKLSVQDIENLMRVDNKNVEFNCHMGLLLCEKISLWSTE